MREWDMGGEDSGEDVGEGDIGKRQVHYAVRHAPITMFLSLTAFSCLRACDNAVDFSSNACLVLLRSSSALLAPPSSVGRFRS